MQSDINENQLAVNHKLAEQLAVMRKQVELAEHGQLDMADKHAAMEARLALLTEAAATAARDDAAAWPAFAATQVPDWVKDGHAAFVELDELDWVRDYTASLFPGAAVRQNLAVNCLMLFKLRQLEKSNHFLERRSESLASLPSEVQRSWLRYSAEFSEAAGSADLAAMNAAKAGWQTYKRDAMYSAGQGGCLAGLGRLCCWGWRCL